VNEYAGQQILLCFLTGSNRKLALPAIQIFGRHAAQIITDCHRCNGLVILNSGAEERIIGAGKRKRSGYP